MLLATNVQLDVEVSMNALPEAFLEKNSSPNITGAIRLGLGSQSEIREGVAGLGWRERRYRYRHVQKGLPRLKRVGYRDKGIAFLRAEPSIRATELKSWGTQCS
jgi:hypothetical protein